MRDESFSHPSTLIPHPFKGLFMFKQIIVCAMLLAVLPMTSHAGQGTIEETDDAIIVEFSGESDADVQAAKIAREREVKQAEIDAERQRAIIEQSKAKKDAKEAAKNAKSDADAGISTGTEINAGEEKKEGVSQDER
jgi:hypothetical protein